MEEKKRVIVLGVGSGVVGFGGKTLQGAILNSIEDVAVISSVEQLPAKQTPFYVQHNNKFHANPKSVKRAPKRINRGRR